MNDDKQQTHFGFKTVTEDKKASLVADVFHSVAKNYDIMNDVMSFGLHRIWKKFTLFTSEIKSGDKILDIAGGTTGAWENGAVYDGGVTIGPGTCGKLAPGCCEGKYGYLNVYSASAINQIYRYDVKARQMSPEANTNFIQAGTAAAGDRIATMLAVRSKSPYEAYSVILQIQHLATLAEELVIQ